MYEGGAVLGELIENATEAWHFLRSHDNSCL